MFQMIVFCCDFILIASGNTNLQLASLCSASFLGCQHDIAGICCCAMPWAFTHTGKWVQLTPPGKMDEKLKSENTQKEQFSEWGGAENGENGAMLTT